MLNRDIKPRFEVHDRTGESVRAKRMKRDAEKGMNVEVEVEESYGYDVFFPNGNSMRVTTTEELKRLGFDNPASFIDMESGDEVGSAATSLKQQVSRKGRARKPAHTTSTEASS